MIEFLLGLFGAFVDFLLAGSPARVGPHTCQTCKSYNLFETGQGYTRTEPVGLEGADVMVHYREYRCTDCGDRCHIRAD
jgi:hypothetical protein